MRARVDLQAEGWQVVGALRTADGKKKYFYGRTRDEVVQKLNRAIGRQLDGLPLPNERTTLAGYLRDWLELSARPNVRPWTYRGYEVHVRRHIVPALGKVPLAKLTTAQVRRWVSDKLKGGLAPKTVHYMKTTLSTALIQAVGDGLVARNVAATVRTCQAVAGGIGCSPATRAMPVTRRLQCESRLAP